MISYLSTKCRVGKEKLCPSKGSDDFDKKMDDSHLGGGFKHFLLSPLPGEMIQFD